jgi:hypothetical protein
MNDTPPELASRRWTAAAVALLAASVLAFGLQWRVESQVPKAGEWPAVWSALGAQFQRGHGVLVQPVWAAADWPGLAAVLEAADAAQGETLLHADPLDVADTARFREIWVVLVGSTHLPDLLDGAERVHASENVALHRFVSAAPAPSFDALAALDTAEVSRVDPAGRRSECKHAAGRHRCGTVHAMDVFAAVLEVGNTRRRALHAHAQVKGGALEMRYPSAILGKVLTGGVGNQLAAVRKEEGAAVTAELLVDGALLWSTTVEIGDFSWQRFSLDTSASAGRPAEVVLRLVSTDGKARQLAWDAVSF